MVMVKAARQRQGEGDGAAVLREGWWRREGFGSSEGGKGEVVTATRWRQQRGSGGSCVEKAVVGDVTKAAMRRRWQLE